MTRFIVTLLAIAFLPACSTPSPPQVNKPDLIRFGASRDQVLAALEGHGTIAAERTIEPIQLPTARHAQTQIDVEGFMYAGKPRKMELVFADDSLDLVWILTEADEETAFIEAFRQRYGEPTHRRTDATFFLDAGVAVRNDPHEVLFISERLKAPYAAWLDAPAP